jgi:hypothetical protein
MATQTEALRACLNLMNRAAPHPADRDLWHDTIVQASKVLAQHDRHPRANAFAPSPRRHLILTTLAATALSALTITATAWADSWPITTAAAAICVLLALNTGRNVIMDWRARRG